VKAFWKNYGLYSESSATRSVASGDELEQVAVDICAAMIRYGQDTPRPVHYGSLELWERLREPFRLLENVRVGDKRLGESAESRALHAAMEVGKNGSALELCREFVKHRGLNGRGEQ
jgi:hypothetical protein